MKKFEALRKNNTRDLIPKLENNNIISCKWVFKIKHNLNCSAVRHKVTLVAEVYRRKKGIDYEETFIFIINLFLFE